MTGKKILHYTILEKLGEGGMGVVYKSEDTKLNRTVALKFLPPNLTSDKEAKERFLNEAQAASKLDHPNICAVHEIGETPDHGMYIVMPYYEGETLKEKIAQGPIPFTEAMDIVTQISKGLAKAHSNNIIHRDIKPGNIVVTHPSRARPSDTLLGLCRLCRSG